MTKMSINSIVRIVLVLLFGVNLSFASQINLTLNENQTYNLFIENSINKTVTLKSDSTLPTGFTLSFLTQPTVSTFAGSGISGSTDGTGTSASFAYPKGVAVDSSGNVYVADTNNNKIRKITPDGVVTTLAGSGDWDDIDGTGTSASFANPNGVAVDNSGNVYVADTYNDKIRKITPDGVVTTFAGSGSSGSIDGTGTSALFDFSTGITVDNNGNIYVADTGNHTIRKITPLRSELSGSITIPGNYSFTLLINEGGTTTEQTYNLVVKAIPTCSDNEKLIDNICVDKTCQEDNYNCPTTQLLLKGGWNLKSLPVNKTLYQSSNDLSNTFGTDAIIWKYNKDTNPQWLVYADGTTIPTTIDTLTTLKAGEGFWVKIPSDVNRTVVFDSTEIYDITTLSDFTNATTGWHLFGTGETKTVNELNQINSNISIMWKYKDEAWQTTYTGTLLNGISTMNNVEAGEGFWILIK